MSTTTKVLIAISLVLNVLTILINAGILRG